MAEEKITMSASQMDFLCGFFGKNAVLEHFYASTKETECVVSKDLFLASWGKLVEKWLQKDEPVKFDQHLKMCRFLDQLPEAARFEATQLWLKILSWEPKPALLAEKFKKKFAENKRIKETEEAEVEARNKRIKETEEAEVEARNKRIKETEEAEVEARNKRIKETEEAEVEARTEEKAERAAVETKGRKPLFTTGEKIMLGSVVLGVVGCSTLACTVPRENSERAFEICGEVVGAMFVVGLIWHLASNFNSAGPSSAPVSPNAGPGVLRSR